MAIYRSIQMSFWTDTKIDEDFTADEKYIYLYLLTNPLTNLCGCYEIGKKQMANQTGFGVDRLEKILDRMQNEHKVIIYSNNTKEILILHWNRYNWNGSEQFRKALSQDIKSVKDDQFREYLNALFDGNDTVSIPYQYPIDTTRARNTVPVTDTVSVNTTENTSREVEEKPNKQAKHKHGEYGNVLLTDDELKKLQEEYGTDKTNKAIKFLDEYIVEKGKKYQSCYMAIRRWVFNAVDEKEQRDKRAAPARVSKNRFNNFDARQYDYSNLEQQILSAQRTRDG